MFRALHHWLIAVCLLASYSSPAEGADSIVVSGIPANVVYGQRVALTATVSPSSLGKITFYDGTTVLGSAAIQNGSAMLITSELAPGIRAITARFGAAVSAPFSETVTANPGGAFVSGANLSLGGNAVVAGDFNHDGFADLAVTTSNGNFDGPSTVAVYLGNGDGTFRSPTKYLSGTTGKGLVIGDFDLDGNPDLVATTADGLYILLGGGDGTFQVSSVLYGISDLYSVQMADLNGDGIPDLVAPHTGTVAISVLIGNGDGSFQPPLTASGGPGYYGSVADFNNDGKADLAVGTTSGIQVLYGRGDGTFASPIIYGTGGIGPVNVGDPNRDGIPDLLYSTSAALGFLPGLATGGFGTPALSPGCTGQITLDDFDGDGNTDVLAGGASVCFGNGDGTFGNSVSTRLSGGIVAIADFNQDGIIDFAFSGNGGTTIQLGRLAPRLTISATPATGPVGQPETLRVTSSRNDATGTISFMDLPLFGTQTTLGTVALVNGAVTFQANAPSRGPHQYWATYSGDAQYAATQTPQISVTINQPGPAITVSASPNPAIVGQSVTISVSLSFNPGNAQVAIFDGTVLLGTQIYYDRPITYTTTFGAGTHQLRAVFPPYGGYSEGSSDIFTETVNALPAGQLSAGPTLTTGSATPVRVFAADFNNDGYTDIAVLLSSPSGYTVEVLPGTGLGTFEDALVAPIGFSPGGMTLWRSNDYLNRPVYGNPGLLIADTIGNMIVPAAIVPNLNSSGTFVLSVGNPGYSVGTGPVDIASADFNGDGFSDIVTANSGSNDVSLLLSPGTSEAGGPFAISAGYRPSSIVAGDFNGDGKADFAVANRDSSNVQTFLGKGDGTFQMPVATVVGSSPIAMVARDFTGDGKLDLAVLDGGSGQVTILAGHGDGSFSASSTLIPGAGAQAIEAADFDGGGYQSIAVATASSVVVFSQDGRGNFGAPVAYPALAGAASITAGNFSVDGRMELAAALPASNSVSFLFNDRPSSASLAVSASTIAAGTPLTFTINVTPSSALGWATVYDGGNPLVSELVYGGPVTVATSVLSAGTHQLSLRFIGGPGYTGAVSYPVTVTVTSVPSVGFAAPLVSSLFGTPQYLLPGDFANRGKVDLLFAGTVLYGNGDGTFLAGPGPSGGNGALTDLNNDGLTDFVGLVLSNNLQAGINLGSGQFYQNYQPYDDPMTQGTSLAPGDFNGDGWPDVALGNPNGSLDLFLGVGDGTFRHAINFPLNATPTVLASGDFNEDGRKDVLAAGNLSANADTLNVMIGGGNATFTTSTISIAPGTVSIAVGDLNGDRHQDVVIAHATNNTLSVLLGNGDGTFRVLRAVSLSGTPATVMVSDLDGDGNQDLAVMFTATSPAFAVLYGNGDGTFQNAVTYNDAHPPTAMAVADVNLDGRPDLALATDDGNGNGVLEVFEGTNTALTVKEGSGQSSTIRTAFSQALQVNAPPGAAVIFTAPSAGASCTFGGIYLTATATASQSGIALAVCTANAIAGSYTVVASIPGKATSTSFHLTNTAGAPASITAVSGTNFPQATFNNLFGVSFQAQVKDPSGNPVPNVNVVFSVPTTGASATFAGITGTSATILTDANGIATAPPLTANAMAGNYTLSATTSGVPAAATFPVGNTPAVIVTIGTSFAGAAQQAPVFIVDGAPYTTTTRFTWNAGDQHTVAIATQQTVLQERFLFTSWSDGGTASHTITVPSNAAAITANVTGQFQIDTSASPGGTVDLVSGYHDAGPVTITATANPGFAFDEFDFSGLPGTTFSRSNPVTVTPIQTTTIAASFVRTTPFLKVSLTHNGNFAQGETEIYTITIDNKASPVSSSGMVTVTETPDANMTLVSMSGLGWTCAANTCTRSDSLYAGLTYPVITVTVMVAANAPSQVLNQAEVTGGGSPGTATSDPTGVGAMQTITFGPISSLVYGVRPFTVNPTASSGLTVTLTSQTAAVCSVSAFTITIISGGVCTLVATQTGNGVYGMASPVTRNIAITPASQSLTFPAIGTLSNLQSPYQVTVSASSHMSVTLSVSSSSVSVCTASGTMLLMYGTGNCTITATQFGNASYQAASATQQIVVTSGKAAQTISFTLPANLTLPTGDESLIAASTSGLPVTFTSTTTRICTVSGSTVTALSAGTCSITATQDGNSIYLPAPPVVEAFTINPALGGGFPVTCDLNGDGIANVSDVQGIVNEALGVAPATNDLNRDGLVNVTDVQIVVNAALGLGCSAN